MNIGEMIIELSTKLKDSEEQRRLEGIDQFSLSLQIFKGNTQDLLKPLKAAQKSEVALPLGAAKNRHLLDGFLQDLARRIHNFVSAALSLVDHARRFVDKHYEAHSFSKEYNEQISKRFIDDPTCQFVQGLRNYMLHRKIPNVSFITKIVVGGENFEHTLNLDRDELIDWEKWSGPARRFLQETKREINLYQIVTEYAAKIEDFYAWFYRRLREIHEPDLRVVNMKKEAIRKLVGRGLPRDLNDNLNRLEKTLFPPEEMFLDYVAPDIYYKLTHSDKTPEERATALLDYISDYAPISPDSRNRVVEAFKRYYKNGMVGG